MKSLRTLLSPRLLPVTLLPLAAAAGLGFAYGGPETADAAMSPVAQELVMDEAEADTFSEPFSEPVRTVEAVDAELIGTGAASWYGPGFAGRPTASGETFDPGDLTAAHKTLPLGSMVRVTNVSTGDSVVVRVNDRGPYAGDRILDLSEEAADRVGIKAAGVGQVRLELLK